MGQLVEEVKIWNTPVIGAYLLWRFTNGYSQAHPNGDAPIGILHFIAVSILTNERLLGFISDKRPDLQSYIRSFEETKDSDLLMNVQDRIKSRRHYTLKAIDIGISEGLLAWDVNSGKVYSNPLVKSPLRGNSLREFHKRNGLKAEILGKWFSQHDLLTITSYFKVVL